MNKKCDAISSIPASLEEEGLATHKAFGEALSEKDFRKAKGIASSFSFRNNVGWLYKEALRFKGSSGWTEINEFMKSQFSGWESWLSAQ